MTQLIAVNHLNYFEPYSGGANEDNLTRAFLVVLRHSSSALSVFYDSIREEGFNAEQDVGKEIPALSDLALENLQLGTQVEDLSNYRAGSVLSVLLTDEELEIEEVEESERGARYDGVISFPSLMMVVENKPRSKDVWEEQLNPNLEDTEKALIQEPVVLEWSAVISKLHECTSLDSVGGAEELLIEDFLEFVNRNYPYLNPYDTWERCGGEEELLERRIKNILEDITDEPDRIHHSKRWSKHYLQTRSDKHDRVGLDYFEGEDGYGLRITFHPGDVMSRARQLYGSSFDYDDIRVLMKNGWKFDPNFHIAHMQRNLVWFDTPEGQEEDYVEFWKQEIDEKGLNQIESRELEHLLERLEERNVIEIGDEKRSELKEKVYDTDRTRINICPGLSFYYHFDYREVAELDDNDRLEQEVAEKIREIILSLDDEAGYISA